MSDYRARLKDWTPKDYPVRLAGHTLDREGAAFRHVDCNVGGCAVASDWTGGTLFSGSATGHARCSCGWVSEHLTSGGARKRAHRDHKREVAEAARAGRAEDAGEGR
jgi:hypothetical protein